MTLEVRLGPTTYLGGETQTGRAGTALEELKRLIKGSDVRLDRLAEGALAVARRVDELKLPDEGASRLLDLHDSLVKKGLMTQTFTAIKDQPPGVFVTADGMVGKFRSIAGDDVAKAGRIGSGQARQAGTGSRRRSPSTSPDRNGRSATCESSSTPPRSDFSGGCGWSSRSTRRLAALRLKQRARAAAAHRVGKRERWKQLIGGATFLPRSTSTTCESWPRCSPTRQARGSGQSSARSSTASSKRCSCTTRRTATSCRCSRPTFDRAQDDDSGTIVSGRGVVSAAVLLASLGDDTDPEGVLAEWIEVAARDASTVSDADRHDFALVCVALGQDDRVVDLVGGTIPTFEAGQIFGPDKPSFARYLVAAAEADAPVSDVVPAWTSFVLDFPAALQTGSVRWSCLLHVGYAVYTRFADREPADVMTSIREFVAEMLEMG